MSDFPQKTHKIKFPESADSPVLTYTLPEPAAKIVEKIQKYRAFKNTLTDRRSYVSGALVSKIVSLKNELEFLGIDPDAVAPKSDKDVV